jgi:hypothetical protein
LEGGGAPKNSIPTAVGLLLQVNTKGVGISGLLEATSQVSITNHCRKIYDTYKQCSRSS